MKLTGATVHFVSEECDGGPIVSQKAVEGSARRHPGGAPAPGHGAVRVAAPAQAVSLFCQDR